MQGLHPAVHDLGKAGVVSHLDDRHAGRGERLGRAACGENLDAALAEEAAELGEARLVGNREQGALDRRCGVDGHRSEEHTSELQSLMRISYAVFCLKKNTTILSSHIDRTNAITH